MITREQMEIIHNEIMERNTRELEQLIQQREKEEINSCIRCGKPITDYEDTEFNQDAGTLTFTYKCACGCYAEQIFRVKYDRTEEIN